MSAPAVTAEIQKLKDTANGLRAVQTKEIRERRVSMQYLLNIQKVRRSVVQTVLNYHASYEKDTMKWKMLLEDSFWMKEPVTPFRSFRRSEVDRVSEENLRTVNSRPLFYFEYTSTYLIPTRLTRLNI